MSKLPFLNYIRAWQHISFGFLLGGLAIRREKTQPATTIPLGLTLRFTGYLVTRLGVKEAVAALADAASVNFASSLLQKGL